MFAWSCLASVVHWCRREFLASAQCGIPRCSFAKCALMLSDIVWGLHPPHWVRSNTAAKIASFIREGNWISQCGFFYSNIGVVAFSPLREFCVMLLNFNLFRYLMSPFEWKILRLLEAAALLFFFFNGKSFCARLQSQNLSFVYCGPMCLQFFCCYHQNACVHTDVFEWESLPLVSASARQRPLFWEDIY